jgi:hypothetical protein
MYYMKLRSAHREKASATSIAVEIGPCVSAVVLVNDEKEQDTQVVVSCLLLK